MDELISNLIRIVIFVVIIRRFFKKKGKPKKKTSTSILDDFKEVSTKAQEDAKKKVIAAEKLNRIYEKREMKQAFKEAFDKSFDKPVKNEISLKQNIPTEEIVHSIHEKLVPKSNYQRVQVKSKIGKLKSRNHRRKNNLIDKKTVKQDVVRGIIFKEILSKPRSKHPYHMR